MHQAESHRDDWGGKMGGGLGGLVSGGRWAVVVNLRATVEEKKNG